MKKSILIAVCTLLALSVNAQRYFDSGKIRYRVIKESSVSETVGTVSVAPQEYGDYAGDIVIPLSVKDDDDEGDTYKVIGIDDGAFRNNKEVTSVSLPISIETIGLYAFSGTNFKEIKLPVGALTDIGPFAFSNSQLQSIETPSSVKSIGRGAFMNCVSLEKVYLNDGLRAVGDSAFSKDGMLRSCRLPESLKRIEDYTFYGCVNLYDIKLGSKTKRIGDYAFGFCKSLRKLDLPESILEFGKNAFQHTSLYEFNVPPHVKVIPCELLYHSSVRKVTVPKTLKTVTQNGFAGMQCYDIHIPDSADIAYSAYDFTALYDPSEKKELDAKVKRLKSSLITVNVDFNDLAIVPLENYNYFYWKLKIGKNTYRLDYLPEPGIEYGKLALNKWDINATGDVVVPDIINITNSPFGDKFVITEIDPAAFDNSTLYIETHAKYGLYHRDDDYYTRPGIKSVKLGKMITELDKSVFYGCTAKNYVLPDVELPEGLFYGSLIESYTFPSNITKIPKNFFKDCRLLKSVKIPASIKEIGNEAFANTSISNIVLPSGLKVLGGAVFAGCDKLTKLNLPEKLDTVWNYAFSGMNIKSIKIPNGVKYIGHHAFASDELKYVEFSTNAIISERAFENSKVETIKIAEGSKNIPDEMCCYLRSLNSIILPPTMEEIGIKAFAGTRVKTIAIPEGIKKIKYEAFYKCDSLTSVSLPSSLQEIGQEAFSKCKNLKTLKLSEGLKIIDDRAFEECPIESVTIPSTIENLGYASFYGTKNADIQCDLTKFHGKTNVFNKSLESFTMINVYSNDFTTFGLYKERLRGQSTTSRPLLLKQIPTKLHLK